ncbi:helix-turn-helix domain-containing protein [Streptomyces aurantiacus]|uniref:HTH araC/xylS-type domain-containing protein n=1 Tax=Streptomyces aurantiacus TaxID=47760 RepID=A0A7G1NT35_9ACTN|nr:helix-turn-helix domain-containing protein [Streptomyces aurantiacus]BCL25621.1 hypothetical protein GCM10017557_04800 [Streptomyces aurantiacus]
MRNRLRSDEQDPRELLPVPEKAMRRLLAVPIDGRIGMGGVFCRWLTDLDARATEFTPADVPTLVSVTLDLLASAVTRCLEAETALSPEVRRNALRAQINAFVEDGTSPAAWIRHRRLERCRRDLADPHLNRRPIQAVAARWGFTDPTHFSRLFRTVYGMPPRDFRSLSSQACADRQLPCAD